MYVKNTVRWVSKNTSLPRKHPLYLLEWRQSLISNMIYLYNYNVNIRIMVKLHKIAFLWVKLHLVSHNTHIAHICIYLCICLSREWERGQQFQKSYAWELGFDFCLVWFYFLNPKEREEEKGREVERERGGRDLVTGYERVLDSNSSK